MDLHAVPSCLAIPILSRYSGVWCEAPHIARNYHRLVEGARADIPLSMLGPGMDLRPSGRVVDPGTRRINLIFPHLNPMPAFFFERGRFRKPFLNACGHSHMGDVDPNHQFSLCPIQAAEDAGKIPVVLSRYAEGAKILACKAAFSDSVQALQEPVQLQGNIAKFGNLPQHFVGLKMFLSSHKPQGLADILQEAFVVFQELGVFTDGPLGFEYLLDKARCLAENLCDARRGRDDFLATVFVSSKALCRQLNRVKRVPSLTIVKQLVSSVLTLLIR
jgi:hypothetical protein